MKLLRRRKFIYLLVFVALGWLCIIIYTHTSLRNSIDSVWYTILQNNLDAERLNELMKPNKENNHLKSMVLHNEGMLNFYFLPMQRTTELYAEITSANRDTSYALAPDFTFHIEYGKKTVVLYEDYGPGCIYRIYLFPPLSQDTNTLHGFTSEDLKNTFLNIVIDGRAFWFSLKQVMEGKEWPFLAPINTQHARPASGVGTYTPFCYEKSAKISYQHSEVFPPNLLAEMINCTSNDFLCSTHIYSAVSRLKSPPNTKVSSFATVDFDSHKKTIENAARMLKKPEIYGPDGGAPCLMDCIEMCGRCIRTLPQIDKPGVISSIEIRVFETAFSKPLENWNSILITIHFDKAEKPQVDRVPLGSLFGATGSLNDFKGACMGQRKKFCMYEDSLLDLPSTTMTGYLYFPMPFWRNAIVTFEGLPVINTPLLICSRIIIVENHYREAETAYFHASKSIYTDQVDGWRNILEVNNSWGHIVGLQMEIDNLRANRNVPLNERWAALQADMVLFVDGAKSASMLGTGLEDYFSYAHGFALAENTSYSFVGVYHTSPRRKEPLTWHCYRLHILDPIPFRTSIHFISEGTKDDWFQQETQIDPEHHLNLLKEGNSAISYLVLFYARSQAGGTVTDILDIGNFNSELNHNFYMNTGVELKPKTFTLNDKRYLGNTLNDETFTKTGREFKNGISFTFTLKIFSPNKGVVLRREYYSPPKKWNSLADIFVNEEPMGQWSIPMGSLNEIYSLQQDDFIIGSDITNHKTEIKIKISPKTSWFDISYQVLVIH